MSTNDGSLYFAMVRDAGTGRLRCAAVCTDDNSRSKNPPPAASGMKWKEPHELEVELHGILQDSLDRAGTSDVETDPDIAKQYDEVLQAWQSVLAEQCRPENATKITPAFWKSSIHEIVMMQLRESLGWIVDQTRSVYNTTIQQLGDVSMGYSRVLALHPSTRSVILASLWSAVTERLAVVDSAMDVTDKVLKYLEELREDGASVLEPGKHGLTATAQWEEEKGKYKSRLHDVRPDTVDDFVDTFLYRFESETDTKEDMEIWAHLLTDLNSAAVLRQEYSATDLHTARTRLRELSMSLRRSKDDEDIASAIRVLQPSHGALIAALGPNWTTFSSDARIQGLTADMGSSTIDSKSTKSGSGKKKGKGRRASESAGPAAGPSTFTSKPPRPFQVFVNLNPAVVEAVQTAMSQPYSTFLELLGPEGQRPGDDTADMVPSGQPGSGDGRKRRGKKGKGKGKNKPEDAE